MFVFLIQKKEKISVYRASNADAHLDGQLFHSGGGFLFRQGRGHHTPIYWSLVCVRFSLLQVTALVLLVLPEVQQEEGFQVVNSTSDVVVADLPSRDLQSCFSQ